MKEISQKFEGNSEEIKKKNPKKLKEIFKNPKKFPQKSKEIRKKKNPEKMKEIPKKNRNNFFKNWKKFP